MAIRRHVAGYRNRWLHHIGGERPLGVKAARGQRPLGAARGPLGVKRCFLFLGRSGAARGRGRSRAARGQTRAARGQTMVFVFSPGRSSAVPPSRFRGHPGRVGWGRVGWGRVGWGRVGWGGVGPGRAEPLGPRIPTRPVPPSPAAIPFINPTSTARCVDRHFYDCNIRASRHLREIPWNPPSSVQYRIGKRIGTGRGATTMASENHGAVLRGIERIFNQGSLTGLSEGQLLRQFAAGDEAAFEALVTRHGPMVLGVCRRLLYDPRDVEDAFQATFLVLLRKAGALRDAEALSPWLHGVAYRVAARIRTRRRPAPGRGIARAPGPRPSSRRMRPGTDRAADVDRRGDRPAAGEVPPAGGALLPRGPDARGGGASAAMLGGEPARPARPGAAEAQGPPDPPRPGAGRRTGRAGRGRRGRIRGGPGPARRRDGRHAGPRRDGHGGLGHRFGGGARAGRRRVPGDDRGEAQAGGVLPGRRRDHPGRGHGLAHGPRRLVRPRGPGRRRAGRVARPPARPKAPGRRGERDGPSIEIRVVDQRTGKPLPGVALAVDVDRKPGQRTTTDDAGRAAIAIPAPLPKFLSVVVRKDGFAPVTLWFPSPLREEEIPASYTLTMYPAETIGGVVRDEQGRPVAGVRVAPTIWTNSSEIRVSPGGLRRAGSRHDRRPGSMAVRGHAGRDRPESRLDRVHAPRLPARELAGRPGAGRRAARQGDGPSPGAGAGRPGRRSRGPADPGAKVIRGSDRFGARCPSRRDGCRRPVPVRPRPGRRDGADGPGPGIRPRTWRRSSCARASRRWSSASRRAGRSRAAWSTPRASRWPGRPSTSTAGAGIGRSTGG